MSVPSYIAVPTSALPIPSPDSVSTGAANAGLAGAAAASSQAPANTLAATFPPAAAAAAAAANIPARRFAVPSTSSLSSNVSDLVLSSLLPPNIPKVAASHAPGRVRELTSQKESLGLNVMSGNFTRFIMKVCSVEGGVLCGLPASHR